MQQLFRPTRRRRAAGPRETAGDVEPIPLRPDDRKQYGLPRAPRRFVLYAAFDLDGYAHGRAWLLRLGKSGVAGASLIFDPGAFGLLQNGGDAARSTVGSGSDFPTGTIPTTTQPAGCDRLRHRRLQASGLLPLLNAETADRERKRQPATARRSRDQRCPNGMGGFRNASPYTRARRRRGPSTTARRRGRRATS